MLSSFEEMNNALKAHLEQHCEGIDFVRSFPAGSPTSFPIRGATVSVGIKNAKLPFGESIFLGRDTAYNSYYGVTAMVEYILKICVPKNAGSTAAYDAFDCVANACIKKSELFIYEVGCEDISYDRIMGALVLKAHILATAELLNEKKREASVNEA